MNARNRAKGVRFRVASSEEREEDEEDEVARAAALERKVMADKLASMGKLPPAEVHDEAFSQYSWGRESNLDFNYDLSEASVLDAAGMRGAWVRVSTTLLFC